MPLKRLFFLFAALSLIFLFQPLSPAFADWTIDPTLPTCGIAFPDTTPITTSKIATVTTNGTITSFKQDGTDRTSPYTWVPTADSTFAAGVRSASGNLSTCTNIYIYTNNTNPVCNTVNLLNPTTGAFGLIRDTAPTINQVNYAYSDTLGITSGATCTVTITNCGATIDTSNPDNINATDCYVSGGTSDYRARVDFTPYTQTACAVTFTLAPPSSGGDQCFDTSPSACSPVNGGWSGWNTCSATCGGGTQTRTCTSPLPSCGGTDCSGLDGGNSIQECETQACPINGDWSNWSVCTGPCGGTGTQIKTCTNPPPANGGSECTRADGTLTTPTSPSESQNCTRPACPWIQVTGDVHSNTSINAPGGP